MSCITQYKFIRKHDRESFIIIISIILLYYLSRTRERFKRIEHESTFDTHIFTHAICFRKTTRIRGKSATGNATKSPVRTIIIYKLVNFSVRVSLAFRINTEFIRIQEHYRSLKRDKRVIRTCKDNNTIYYRCFV